MHPNQAVDLNLAIFLGECCIQTYTQYENDGLFEIPKGYELVEGFKATSIVKEEWFGFIIKSVENIILAFRGTHSHLDWIEDAEIAQVNYPFVNKAGETHRGFTEIYNSCRDQIISVLENLPPSIPLYVTGHSLGAALAVLAILDIAENSHFKHASMFNFAGPRVGNPRFANNYNTKVKESIRIVNLYDIVPNCPPIVTIPPLRDKWWLYKHVHKEFSIATQTGSILGNHDIHSYVAALKLLKEGEK